MDLAAIAETTVEMWVHIDAKLTARSQDKIDPVIKSTLLREAMSLYITDIINKKRSSGGGEQPEERAYPASDKQIKYIADLGGDPLFKGSAEEASAEITRLKAK